MIRIEGIDHKDQRYNTCGDWQFVGHDLLIKVSRTDNEQSDFLVAIHELIEAFLCIVYGVSGEAVDAWDMNHEDLEDPGNHPEAPYHDMHIIAEMVERMLCSYIAMSWDEHDERLARLVER